MILRLSCVICRRGYLRFLARFALFCVTVPLVKCLPAYAAGPSFDCSKASQPDERIICGSEELSALELKASREFAYVRDNIHAERARQTARAVLGERHNCGAKADCIKGVLSRAIQSYEALGAPNNSAVIAQPQVSPGSYSVLPNVSDGILNIRSGPGQGHSIVVAIPAGSGGVTIGSCQTADDGRSRYSWCKAQWKNYSGWVSSSGIVADAGATASPSVTPKKISREACNNATVAQCMVPCGAFYKGGTRDAQAKATLCSENCNYQQFDLCMKTGKLPNFADAQSVAELSISSDRRSVTTTPSATNAAPTGVGTSEAIPPGSKYMFCTIYEERSDEEGEKGRTIQVKSVAVTDVIRFSHKIQLDELNSIDPVDTAEHNEDDAVLAISSRYSSILSENTNLSDRSTCIQADSKDEVQQLIYNLWRRYNSMWSPHFGGMVRERWPFHYDDIFWPNYAPP
jgi:hypothetical protein